MRYICRVGDLNVSGDGSTVVIAKVCSRCNTSKPASDFRASSRNADGLQVWCRPCFSEYERERYKNGDRARKFANRERSRDRARDLIWNYLEEHPCVDCGNSDPRVLEFDHRDPSEKDFSVLEMVFLSPARIRREISKCDVRCANCHRIRTAEQFQTWKFFRAASVTPL